MYMGSYRNPKRASSPLDLSSIEDSESILLAMTKCDSKSTGFPDTILRSYIIYSENAESFKVNNPGMSRMKE
jgi:hypothetical protein